MTAATAARATTRATIRCSHEGMILDKRPYTFDRVVRIGIAAALIWALVWLMGRLNDVLIPFAAAVLLAYLIIPLVRRIQKRIHKRGWAVLLSLLLVGIVASGLWWFFIPIVVHEVADMGRILSEIVHNSDIAERAAERLPPNLWQAIKDLVARDDVQAFFKTENFADVVKAVGQKVLPGVWGLITGTANFLVALVGLTIIGLYLVFLLIDYEMISHSWRALLPPTYRKPVADFLADFENAMNRYFRGQAAMAFIVGILYALGFWIIGLPMGILLGLFIGLLNMVPYLQVVGLIPAYVFATIHALETGGSLWLSLALVTVVVVVTEVVQGAVLMPRIMGKVTGLRPVVILLSLSIWGKLLGVFGLLIALPMTCLLYAYYRRFILSVGGEADSSFEVVE
ncbi:MAG: AI-2E family transporter [Candidatus Krumholzibacteria bacterium]